MSVWTEQHMAMPPAFLYEIMWLKKQQEVEKDFRIKDRKWN